MAIAFFTRHPGRVLWPLLLLPLLWAGCRFGVQPETPLPEEKASPVATPPLAGQEPWVEERIGAIVALYRITPEGEEVLRGLDVRRMEGQPGYFGSSGYRGWVGIGEAKPIQVLHELMHSYWGAFPVTGHPELGWEAPPDGELPPALERYHRDVLDFMAQPPDGYELLRERLRNLPELSIGNLDPLLHTVEADLVYTVAGDLNLLPPILRKYWDRFLQPGPFSTWYEAVAWYLSLPQEEKRLADAYLGFEHFDLRDYKALRPSSQGRVSREAKRLLEREERQRLLDFAQQFDLLIGEPQQEENFNFWRGYLRDKMSLHRRYPDLLRGLGLERGRELADALDLLASLEGRPTGERVRLLARGIRDEPLVAHLLPLLDNRTLLALFTSGVELPEEATLKGTAGFVELLERFAPQADRIIGLGREDIGRGAAALAAYLGTLDLGRKEELGLFFELLSDSDPPLAGRLVSALDDATLRRLLEPIPARLRGMLAPERLLKALGVTLDTPAPRLVEGLSELLDHTSGNFLIDEPFLDAAYRVVAEQGRDSPAEMLVVLRESGLPLARFLRLHPEVAVHILSSDLEETTDLVEGSDPVLLPPARFVYHLIQADPHLAAEVVMRLDGRGREGLVLEALAHFAYDADRLRAVPGLPISLRKDGLFLARLLEARGEGWLTARLRAAVQSYRGRLEAGEVEPDFLEAYRRTLEGASAELEDGEVKKALRRVVDRAFRGR